MKCSKCGYIESNPKKLFGKTLCKICFTFAPQKIEEFQEYVLEKIDWKSLETFRKTKNYPGMSQKKGMNKKASVGFLVSRPPLGYSVENGNLIPNEESYKIRSIFKTFISRNYSLNSMAKNFSLSTNGLKKILTNRVYLGEIKFDKKIYQGNHPSLISPEIFYAVQRKIKTYSKPRKIGYV